jgi:CBS domain-containing protein
MREHGFRRMPVVNELGELAGIVSMDDYLGLLAEEMAELARLIAREQGRESAQRR